MRELFIKYFSRILAVLGCSTMVTACYGVPEMPFEVKGRVVDAETGKPIQNIKVTVTAGVEYGNTTGVGSVSTPEYSDTSTAYTSKDGEIEMTLYEYFEPAAYIIECQDVDGESNGEYEYAKVAVPMENSQAFVLKMTPND